MNYDYSFSDIIHALKEAGVRKSDNIFIHSNLGFFGKLRNASSKEEYCQLFKKAIFDVITENGTLVVPTYSYSFCNGENFDIKKTPSVCGMFSEHIRNEKASIRSYDANFSIAAIGKNSKFLTENSPQHSFGKDSFWEKFLKCEGKICNLNFDSGSTFIHYVERLLSVPYRFDKKFSGKTLESKKLINSSYYHFVYDLKKAEDAPDFTKFDKKARELGLSKIANLGKGQIVCISTKDALELIKNEIKNNPYFLRAGIKTTI